MRIVLLLTCVGIIYCSPARNDITYSNRVVGGWDAPPKVWKWQVSLQYDAWNMRDYAHICGGTVVHTSYIMTAAHCILSLDTKLYRVATGEYNIYEYDGSEQFSFVERIAIHPSWTGDLGNGNDIALLKLAIPIYDNGFVEIANLPHHEEHLPNDFFCYITGWGLLATGGAVAAVLQEAPIRVVPHAVCSSPEWWGDLAKKSMICAGGDGVTSGCQGDSGGPLSCFRDGVWRVHGMVSYGPAGDCNTPTKPTVFTSVAFFLDWIYNVILS